MTRGSQPLVLSILVALCLNSILYFSEAQDVNVEKSKLYIVYMGKNHHPTVEATHAAHHHALSHVFDSEVNAVECLVYHYKHAFNGFSAMLTQSQADIISQLPGVVSVFESQELTSQTTRSYSYLGLNPSHGLWPEASFGGDVIIGVLDTGIWPESESFNDEGLSPVPARWNGTCEAGELFDPKVHCNRKLIGARWFNKGYEANLIEMNETAGPEYVKSARDMTGHGTHCASTSAGANVENASLFGLASGVASGGAPAARIAVYKVLWGEQGTATDADILAGFDQAVVDGVDILSVSIAGGLTEFYASSLAIGSYHATEAGILVSIAAGNDGPDAFTTTNVAPWMLTVAASTSDRQFQADVELGDGTIIQARAVKDFNFTEAPFPLVDGAMIPAANAASDQSRFCELGSLDPEWARGSIVLCEMNGTLEDSSNMEVEVLNAGGAGVIILGSPAMMHPDSGYPYKFLNSIFFTPIPAVGISDRVALDTYMALCTSDLTCSSTAIIRRTKTVLNNVKDPAIATFSSRGPNSLAFDILKPDITAPGVDILAAWPESDYSMVIGPDRVSSQYTKFNLLSGTSMATPHVSGLSALVKAKHPHWSPAAIKSALMTSAIPLNRGSLVEYGAGEVNIGKAVHPGLVYDMTPQDYKLFLCGRNYTDAQFEQITQEPISICASTTASGSGSLNYPSITFSSMYNEGIVVRTVTNVGAAHSVYNVTVVQPDAAVLSVSPTTLSFTKRGQKLSYTVTAQILRGPDSSGTLQHSQGYIVWTDAGGRHTVTSPVSIWNYLL